jgi:hypothetical protein
MSMRRSSSIRGITSAGTATTATGVSARLAVSATAGIDTSPTKSAGASASSKADVEQARALSYVCMSTLTHVYAQSATERLDDALRLAQVFEPSPYNIAFAQVCVDDVTRVCADAVYAAAAEAIRRRGTTCGRRCDAARCIAHAARSHAEIRRRCIPRACVRACALG